MTSSQTPIASASGNGHIEIVRLLLARPDIDVNKEVCDQHYPSHRSPLTLFLFHSLIDDNHGFDRFLIVGE